ncbi:ATP phosphoribosyltransferase regulatory subunit [Fundicoccus sp. Sow4_D5]|uniref:ATP phosphoribosyltransferase regulatory subunit n=1 Tax=unclassified Fundicoccus TaxID=2761543 RepID=UPI003F92A221
MDNQMILKQIQLVSRYMQLLANEGYQLIDLNMVEPFQIETKNIHPDSIVFERNQQLFALRSDWTRSILNYNQSFQLSQQKFAYFGPVLREFQTQNQAGVELFRPTLDEMLASIELHLEFVANVSKSDFTVLVVNNDELLDRCIKHYQLGENVKQLVVDKNLSTLKDQLGDKHPLYQLMKAPVSQQFDRVNELFGNCQEMKMIHQLKEKMQESGTRFVLDLSFRSPQSYYNGFYFQAFLSENTPILSGGQYAEGAFGIGINLSKGGLL